MENDTIPYHTNPKLKTLIIGAPATQMVTNQNGKQYQTIPYHTIPYHTNPKLKTLIIESLLLKWLLIRMENNTIPNQN
jgi:hypothetical protein